MVSVAKTSNQLFTNVTSVVNAFIRLREVKGDVACLESEPKKFEYLAILRVKAIHFSQMAENEQQSVIESFQRFMDTLAFPIQILIRNRSYDPENYLQGLAGMTGKGPVSPMTRDHIKFVRFLASRRVLVTREFYIILPADKPATKSKTEALIIAQEQLKQRIEELSRQLKQVGLGTKRLKTQEIIQFYQGCYTPWEEPFSDDTTERGSGSPLRSVEPDLITSEEVALALQKQELQRQKQKARQEQKEARDEIKNKIVPKCIQVPDLILPTSVQIAPSYLLMKRDENQEYLRTLAVVSYPHTLSAGWFERIIQVNEANIDFILHVKPLSGDSTVTRLNRKALQLRRTTLTSMRQGRAADQSVTSALKDIEKLRENIVYSTEQALMISVFIQIRGRDRRELDERSDYVAKAIHELECRSLPTHWQHHLGLLSCLPSVRNQLGRGRLFGTSAAATFYPFIDSEISMETGVMLGVHPAGSLVVLNPFKRSASLENGNMILLAKSGAGKSFFFKTVASRLLPSCQIYTLAPGAEYDAMCELVKGERISLTADSLLINPFEFHGKTGDSPLVETPSKKEVNFFREKMLNLISLLELLLSAEGILSQKEKAVLYSCLMKAYENHGITPDPVTHGRQAPTMQEFYDILSRVLPSDGRPGIAQDLAERLRGWLALFPAQTQIITDNRFVSFNLNGLNEILKPVGMFLIVEYLWTKLHQAKLSAKSPISNTLLLFDEIWPLMQFQQGAKVLSEFSRRISSYNGCLWCSTQYVGEFLQKEESMSIQAQSALKFVMRQDINTIYQVAQSLQLNPAQLRFLQKARRGEGLFATKNWSQMEVLASPLEAHMASISSDSDLPTVQEQIEVRDTLRNRPQPVAYED